MPGRENVKEREIEHDGEKRGIVLGVTLSMSPHMLKIIPSRFI